MSRCSTFVAVSAVGILMLGGPALAGPPLLCHPFDIGTAQSLPWDGSRSWSHGRADYNVQHLVSDVQTVLHWTTPVIVRMETLRRAAIYGDRDPGVAAQLLDALTRRVSEAERLGASAHALALFDAGYLAETLEQMAHVRPFTIFRGSSNVLSAALARIDGNALITRALTLNPHDPSLQFGAALVSASSDRQAYRRHADAARRRAATDTLLARNISQIS